MAEVREAYYPSDLVPPGGRFGDVLVQLQYKLSLVGINAMKDVVDLAFEIHKKTELVETKDPSGNLAYTPQIKLELDVSDKDALWGSHRQLQACAMLAFGLWQNDSFKVHTGTRISLEEGIFGAIVEPEYVVFRRGAISEEVYMRLFFTYLVQAKKVRDAFAQ